MKTLSQPLQVAIHFHPVHPQLKALTERGGGGQGGGNPGVMGAGGLLEAGEEGEVGYRKGEGAGRNGKNFATLAQYFAIGKVRGDGSRYERGRERGVQGAGGGMFRPPCPPPPPILIHCFSV